MAAMTRPRSSAATRRRILDAAEELFASDGFDATPTSRVAERAGVYKGLLFHHFPRKIDLLLALVERVQLEELCPVAAEAVPGDVAATLLRVADDYERWLRESATTRTVLLREAETHPEVRDRLAAISARLVDRAGEAIDAALGEGGDPGRRAAAAAAFVSVVVQRHRQRNLGLPGADLAAIAELLAAALGGRA
jgi:AcrR family transcriptional regulator